MGENCVWRVPWSRMSNLRFSLPPFLDFVRILRYFLPTLKPIKLVLLLSQPMFLKKKGKLSLEFIAFLQAIGLTSYCLLIGFILWNGEAWFGPMVSFVPIAFVCFLFALSALISAFLILGYPIFLFWVEKKEKEALKLVGCTVLWLILFVTLAILSFVIFQEIRKVGDIHGY